MFLKNVFQILCCSVGLMFPVLTKAQSDSDTSPYISHAERTHNAWQQVAKDQISEGDTVSTELRKMRSLMWQKPLQSYFDMTRGSAGSAQGMGSTWNSEEIPSKPNSIWAIVTFYDYHVFSASSNLNELLYTEMNFRVDSIIKEPANAQLKAGDSFESGSPGGCLRLAGGQIICERVQNRSDFFQLHHKYLVLLIEDTNTHYFSALKRWDVTSGVVKPDTTDEVNRAIKGNSRLAGLSIADAVKKLIFILESSDR